MDKNDKIIQEVQEQIKYLKQEISYKKAILNSLLEQLRAIIDSNNFN